MNSGNVLRTGPWVYRAQPWWAAVQVSRFVRLDIDPKQVMWRRVVDINDRFLRGITVGQGPEERGMSRETGFDIAVASEVMAVLALASDLKDLRARWANRTGDLGVVLTCAQRGIINHYHAALAIRQSHYGKGVVTICTR